MPNYKEKTISGKKHQRACRVVIENPYKGTPHMMFVEEEIIDVDGEITTKLISNISVPFDMNGVFEGVNPETDELAGRTITHAEVYALLYSLYKDAITKRDNAQS